MSECRYNPSRDPNEPANTGGPLPTNNPIDAHPDLPFDEQIDFYLDGLLTGPARAAFEQRLAADPRLARQLELQRRVDAALKSRFTPDVQGIRLDSPPIASTIHPERQATSASNATGPLGGPLPAPLRAQLGWMRIAAAIAILALGLYTFLTLRNNPLTLAGPVASYASIVQAGFKPYEVCTTPAEFANYVKERLGTPLSYREVPGLAMIGWSYGKHVLSADTVSCLAKRDGREVVIFMDKASNDRNIKADRPGHTIHRRKLGMVVLYEVVPEGVPSSLDAFEILPK